MHVNQPKVTLLPPVITLTLASALALGAQQAPAPGQAFDAAPFGMLTRDPVGCWQEIRWGEPRKIRQIVVEAPQQPGQKAISSTLRVQYWHGSWQGGPDPVLAETSSCAEGFASMDDWTNGRWKDADTRVTHEGDTVRFTFASTKSTEFPGLANGGVMYRKTLKIRVLGDRPLPEGLRVHALTDAIYHPLTARILWGRPAEPAIKTDAEDPVAIEAFNGSVRQIRALAPGKLALSDSHRWSVPAGGIGEIAADFLTAADPVDGRYDRTIITVRSHLRPFSFAADDVAKGERVLIDDLGVLIVRGDDSIGLDEYRRLRREWAGPTVYERVFGETEQTLSRAVKDMPLRRPMEYVHGLPGDRNVMQQYPNGDLLITGFKFWFSRPTSPKDTAHKDWPANMLEVRFGLPSADLRGGRALQDGWLPLLKTWWKDGAILYEQCTIMDALDGRLADVQLDDPTVLLVKIRIVNTSADKPADARLDLTTAPKPMPLSLETGNGPGDETLIFKNGRVLAERDGRQLLRLVIRGDSPGIISPGLKALHWSRELPPGASHELFLAVPAITLTNDSQVEALFRRDFEADAGRICNYWRGLVERDTQIETPERWLNDFYKSHLLHMLANCWREPGSDRLFPHVGSFRYGVYGNEATMMVSDLERRGRHDLAQRCLDSWLQYQGTVALPGNFISKDGIFYGANRHESGGYNMHHGYILFEMAEHWKFTRDREWMQRAAPGLIKGCDWVTRERQSTMKPGPDGHKPIEHGFLPAGGLEDVQDYWYWLSANAATVRGFDAVAAALADFGHPVAPRLLKDAKAYHDDVMHALNEARIRTPVVRLRDGTYVPKYPSNLYDRGRAYGWIRETLEGAMLLPAFDLLPADSPETRWILKDYEDNLYISDRYGFSIPVFDRFWFSRGGFSMQANLLDGPLPYLKRDEIKHYLRAWFNGFASAFDPAVRMCSEGTNPELGYPDGDHFKTSDEAQCARWLRLMFVHEEGNDLYLGQVIPRYWMEDGKSASIQRAASYFGPLSLRLTSQAAEGKILAKLDPPTRNRPRTIYLRLRHPEGKPMRKVTVNGQSWEKFDINKEWLVLPGTVEGTQEVVATY
jgi:hypothetical protein